MSHEPSPPSDPAATRPAASPPVVSVPDRGAAAPRGYELHAEVGRGGMGAVYRARDASLDRLVAVKVLHPRFAADSPASRRFVEEARITARLQHPGIPPVHQVGDVSDGRPFLAMKLIDGRTLGELLKDRPDPTADRGRLLAVFEQVCQAVGYAHAQGVIHRDLKPANIMVGAFGEVQVMDWGLAKELRSRRAADVAAARRADAPLDPEQTTDHQPDDTDDRTKAGAVMGTPAYMAPEQARGEIDRIDERADVFSLGGILCAILTGMPPHVGGNAVELMRRAAAGDLSAAFERLTACGAEPDLVALCRGCLAPNSADRPRNGGDVARAVADLRTAAEERAKLAEVERERAAVRAAEERKRRRVFVGAAAAIIMVLAAGIGVSAWQAVRATKAEAATADQLTLTTEAEGVARTEAANARAAEIKAKGEEAKAKTSEALALDRERKERIARKHAETVSGFMQDVFSQGGAAGQASVFRRVNRNLTVEEAMDYAVRRLDGAFDDQPEVEAAIRNTIGQTYSDLGVYPKALPQLERAVAIRRKVLGEDSADTLTSITNLASLYLLWGKYDEAEPLLKEVLAGRRKIHGPDHPATFSAINDLGSLYHAWGRFTEAKPLLGESHAGRRRVLGPIHTDTLHSAYAVAALHQSLRAFAKAEPLLVDAVAGFRKLHGPDHPYTLRGIGTLAAVYQQWGKYDQAEPLLEEVVAGCRRALGPLHPDTLTSVTNLAALYYFQKRFADAEPLFRETVAGYRKVLGSDHPHTLTAITNLGGICHAQGKLAEAEPLLREAVDGYRKALGPENPNTFETANALAELYEELRRPADAAPLYELALAARRKVYGPNDRRTREVVYKLANVYYALDRYADAAPLLADTLAERRRTQGPTHPDTLSNIGVLAFSYLQSRQYRKAVPLFEEMLRAYEKQPGPTAELIRADLGLALVGAGEPARAEPHLIAAHKALTKQQALTPPYHNRLRWVIAALADVCDRTDRPEEAAAWRAKLKDLAPEVAPPPRAVKQ